MKMTPQKLYEILQKKFGDLNWWPMDRSYHIKNKSDPRFEVIIGAVLTQNTAWSNVEKALDNLKSKKMLDINHISNLKIKELSTLIKPSGFFNQKADRVKNLSNYLLKNYNGNLDDFFNRDIKTIRKELLSLNGIGPETADSIILYAGNLPVFVVDAYTKRICERIPLNTDLTYDSIQRFFETELTKNFDKSDLVKIYNQLHAMIVILAKDYCKKKPACSDCPLKNYCSFNK